MSLSPLMQKVIKALSQSDLDLAIGREIAEVLWLAQKTQGDFITVESKIVIEPEKEETEEALEEPTGSDDRDRFKKKFRKFVFDCKIQLFILKS
jgi:hypothetical protein